MNISKFENSFQKWSELQEKQRDFFCGVNYLPLPKHHEERISILLGPEARQLIQQLLKLVPETTAEKQSNKRKETSIQLSDVWCDDEKVQEVRQWLYDRGVPFSSTVYLLYNTKVVKTDWKILVTYWDALAWSVGTAMLVTDLTGGWVCEFHHEDVITFCSY